VLVACDLLFVRPLAWPRVAARAALLLLPVLLTVYVTRVSHSYQAMPMPGEPPLGPWLTSAYLMARYLGLLVWPFALSAFYHVPAAGVGGAQAGVLAAGVLGAGAAAFGARKLGLPWPRIMLYAVWIAAGVGPLINPFINTPYLLQDRYLYPALPAFGLFVSEVVVRLCARLKPQAAWAAVVGLPVIFLAFAAVRSFDWHDVRTLFADAAMKQPASAFGHAYLASHLFHAEADERDAARRKALLDIALKAHLQASLCDDYDRLPWPLHYRNEFATLLLRHGHTDKAREQFRKVVEGREERIAERGAKVYALKFLATDALSAGCYEEGMRYLDEALRRAPEDPELLHNRLLAWAQRGEKEKLIEEARRLADHPKLGTEARQLLERLGAERVPPDTMPRP